MRRIFDAHIHCPSRGIFGESLPNQNADFEQELEKLVQTLRANNVSKACLLGGKKGVNDLVLEAKRKYPDLIVPMAYIDLDEDRPDAVDAYAGRGFKGFKAIATHRNYDDESYFPFYERMEKRGSVLLFHTGVLGGITDYLERDPRSATEAELAVERGFQQRKTSSAQMRSIYLDTIGMRFPELRVIGAHLGYGEYDLSCAVARWRRNVYFDLSGGDVVRRHLTERRLIGREISPSKLLFGSDSATGRITHEVTEWVAALEKLELTEDEIDRILYANAAYLFGLE